MRISDWSSDVCSSDLNAADEPGLDAVRAAVERFRDVEVALAEGYVRDPMNMCIAAEQMGLPGSEGAMGIHYFRPDLLGISGPPNPRVDGTGPHTDFLQPSLLLHEPHAAGSLALVAVAHHVFGRPGGEWGHKTPHPSP